jgi:signal transduction histidine kinase
MKWALKAWLVFSATLLAGLSLCAWKLPAGYVSSSVGNVVQTILPLLLTAAMVGNGIRNRGRARAFWLVAAGGAALWAMANGMWAQYEVLLRKPVPVPFIGDVLFFLHIVPFTAAIAVRPHRIEPNDRMKVGGVDFLMLLTWWVYLYLFLVIPWQYVAADRAAYAFNFNLLYTVENAVFVAGCGLLCWRSQGAWRNIYGNFLGASALYLGGSQVVNHAITLGTYYTGSAYDLPLVVAMCWLVATAIHALNVRPEPMAGAGTKWHAIIMARMAMLATLSMPVIGAMGMFVHRPAQHVVVVFRLCVTLGAMFVLPFLLFLKQHLLDRELVRLLRVSEHNLEMRKRLQAQLVQTEKLSSLGSLVAGAAHEINNPLTAILGYSDLLQRDASLLPHARQFAKKIGDQTRRTKNLVSDLLKFGRQTPPVKEAVDLNGIVSSAVELCRLDLRAGVTVTQHLDPILPKISVDPNQMLQVCFDIVGNALEALNGVGGGTLMIRTSHTDGSLFMEFRDTGPGVKEPSKIFDPFYTTKPVGQGTGLRLSAAYGIVREHGGLISCENDGSGGAVFKIMLPLKCDFSVPKVAALAATSAN